MKLLAVMLLVACHHAAPVTAVENPAPAAPGPVLPVTVLAEDPGVVAIAVDGDHLWWTRTDGALRRARRDGRDATTIANIADDGVGAMVVADGVLFGATGDVWSIGPDDDAPRILARDVAASSLLVVGDTIYALQDGLEIDAIPRGGGAPVELDDDVGYPSALASDDTYLYWADEGLESQDIAGSIRRRRLAGGPVEILARDQPAPKAIAVFGDRVYWSNEGDGAIVSAPLAGGAPTTLLAGDGGPELWIDHQGIVVHASERLFERRSDGTVAVRALTLARTSGTALADDGIYAADGDQILRYPRGDAALTVIAASDHHIVDVARDGDQLDYLELGPPDRLMSVAPSGGPARVVRTLSGWPFALAAGGGHVAVVDAGGGIAVVGGGVIATDPLPSAVAIDRDAVYWITGAQLETASLAGSGPRTIYRAPREMHLVCGRTKGWRPADPRDCMPTRGKIVAMGDELLASGGSVFVRVAADGTATALDADAFAVSGSRLATWSDADGLTIDGRVVVAGDDQVGLAGADPRGVWLTRGDDRAGSERIPWDGRTPEAAIADLDIAAMVTLDDAVYFVDTEGDLLLRLAR